MEIIKANGLSFDERFKHGGEDISFNFCDSHLLLKDGVFYLFTSVSYRWTYHLELYYTDDILMHDLADHFIIFR